MPTTDPFDKTRHEVAAKVRKLLTQAEDAAATPEEAQSFTMKAQQLMTKYAIELAMVSDAVNADQFVDEGWTVHGPYAGHKVNLISAIARTNDCRAIYSNVARGRKRIQVVGCAQDVEWVRTLSRSLEIQLACALAGAMQDKPQRVHGRTFAVGFIEGFITEVNSRLQNARHSAAAGVTADLGPSQPADSVALVLADKAQRVDDEFKVRHPGSRTVYSQVRLQSWSGYGPGRAAGRRASIARAAVGDPRKSLSA